MKKRFNTTGVCIPEKHYMADISDKIAAIFKMVEAGDYFVINRPRQYGKTTTISMLNRLLKPSDEYFPIKISFEGIGEDGFKSAAIFIDVFFLQLKSAFKASGNKDLVKFLESTPIPDRIDKLGTWINELIVKIGKKTALMIDEVDKSSNNQLFLDFLGMLRDKYLKRDEEGEFTFHSVILVGVHDVKSLKIKIRPDTEAKFNSPWNIAVDFKIDLCFSPDKIVPMLEDYSKENNVKIEFRAVAEKIFYYTSGYPFLVSKLCQVIDEEILPQRPENEWYLEDIDRAVQLMLKEENTNFESLIKNLENNPDLYDFVFKLIMNGTEFIFNLDNPVIHFGRLYGILKDEQGKARVHNRLYEQRIYNYMASGMETSANVMFNTVASSFIDSEGKLDIKKVILKFQEFMKQQYSAKDNDFIERNGRLLFLAFIRPIINGKGFDFKEVQVSEEKRLDIVITFDNKKYIIELKIWRGEAYHREGIGQLCDYLDRQAETSGYLLIYDLRKESGQTGKWAEVKAHGKTIFTAWV
jgi:hypothetical protein